MTRIKFLFLALLMVSTAMAQKEFTLEDLNYGGVNYYRMTPENRYLTWWGDELVRTDIGYCNIVNKKTGEETLLFTLDDIAALTQSDEHNRMRHLYNATFPYPGQTIVQLINGQEIMLVDWSKKQLLLKHNRDEVQAEDFCTKSKAFAYVKDNNLYVADDNGKVAQLSTDGSREIVYGQSVHRDEFGIEKGTFWSPDGNLLAFYRMDQSMVSDYPQVDIFSRSAEYQPDKYPMAGETSHKVTVGIYNMLTGKTIYLQAGDPTDRYFTNIAWSPDSKTLYMFELNRDQNDCRLVSYDATNGQRIAELYRETHPKYVEPLHPIVFLPWDSSKFIMQSQKDGYNHLYLFNKEGKELKQLTSGEFVVIDVLGFNQKDKSIVVVTNEKSPIQNNLYAVNVATGKRKLLDNGRGRHYGELSSTGEWLYDKYSEPDVPRNINITNTSKAKGREYFSAKNPWEGYKVPEYSCGTIKAADGVTDLYYRMVKPADFDPAKKYPTVIYVYGGPHAHNVDAGWHYASRSWETYMAQKGYVLFILDNRGSENRGREFEQATFRQLGQIEMQDQMMGVEYLKTLPFVDADRLGVHGWSFGGFMTISLMTNYPDVFKVGVAGGPVIDWKWYEVMYGERYMDTPQSNPEGYEKTSLISKAADLKGKLQIISGYNDATVVPQHCLSFIAACIEAGTQPDFFVYPGEPHNMRGHQSVHLHERITQYFEDYLK
ncbi:MAG: S9 family peptidase [Prevotella sp.]|nr:S9 family peptidase [Prevotella sp.]